MRMISKNRLFGVCSSKRPIASLGVKCSDFSAPVIKQKRCFMITECNMKRNSQSFYVYERKPILKISQRDLFCTINKENDDVSKNS